jgi:aminomethyltransferase
LLNSDELSGRMWVGGLMAMSPEAPRRRFGESFSVHGAQSVVGYVTSAAYSPRAQRELCFAHFSARLNSGSKVCFEDGTSWLALPLPLLPASKQGRSP